MMKKSNKKSVRFNYDDEANGYDDEGGGKKIVHMKKRELIIDSCQVVKLWLTSKMSNAYRGDTIQAKIKKGALKLILLSSTDPELAFPLPTADQGFKLMRSVTEPNKCCWASKELPHHNIGYLLTFSTPEKAAEFFKFATTSSRRVGDSGRNVDNNDSDDDGEDDDQQAVGEDTSSASTSTWNNAWTANGDDGEGEKGDGEEEEMTDEEEYNSFSD